MYWIIGTEKQREQFIDSGVFPFFAHEEITDENCAKFYNDDDESATLIVNLEDGTFFVSEMDAYGTICNEREFDSYDEAVSAYDEIES